MTEFITRNYGSKEYKVIIKTDNEEHYIASQEFARKLIDHAKPVTDNNVGCKWIPVSKRLPEDEYTVLVTCGKGYRPFIARYDHVWKRWKVSHTLRITHWMPLPNPPKEEDK